MNKVEIQVTCNQPNCQWERLRKSVVTKKKYVNLNWANRVGAVSGKSDCVRNKIK